MARGNDEVNVQAVQREFHGVFLGDKRLERRVLEIVPALASSPADSFPEQMVSVAEREALYRFLSNQKVTMDALLGGHIEATHERIRGRSVVRILHDTSPFRFAGDREGLGVIRGDTKGFFAHTSLAVSADETREPLGVLKVLPYVHAGEARKRGLTREEQKKASLEKPRAEKTSSRWERQALEVSNRLPPGTRAIHIMDQEADSFDLLGEMQLNGLAFVVRVDPHRRTDANLRTDMVLAERPGTIFRSVQLNPRAKHRHNTPTLPARTERTAHLEVRWGAITIPRQPYSQCESKELVVNAIHVLEPNPPPGEPAVEWMLFTTEPVGTLEEATAIVDHYRARWIIEEYFKALKSGCRLESRQLTSFEGLQRALGLFVPIAWHLLLLRHLSRETPTRPASAVFDHEQLLLLRGLLEKRRYKFPIEPTVKDAMLGIAALGGHIKNNGDPGWLVLGRGFTRFVEVEVGWRMAREMSDQS